MNRRIARVDARQRRLNGNDQPLGRRNAGRIQRRNNQRNWNQTDNFRRNGLMRLISNVENLDTGDVRRDAMLREVNGYIDAALNAIDRYEMNDSSGDDINGALVLNVEELVIGDINNDAENNRLDERPLDGFGIGATVNLGRDEEADILAIHHHQDYNHV